MRGAKFAALAAIVWASGAAATCQAGNAVNGPCGAAGTTVEIANCFAEAAKRSDAELNRLYAQIMTVLERADRQRLQKAERAWLAYRDAACDAEHGLWGGGTGGPPARLACIDGVTREHLGFLRRTYQLRLQRLDR